MDLKKREDLKDQLTEKFKHRFGHGGNKEADEVSVNSATIRKEVESFARKAPITETNLDRLERRIQSRAHGKTGDNASTVSKAISGVSQYTGLSQRSKSATSLVGKSLVAPRKHDWSKLDEYASYLHEQDALRQRLGVQALQRKMKLDLDAQVQDKLKRRDEALEEEKRHYENTLLELERWKQQEKEREDERHQRVLKEKEDRDEQLRYEKLLKDQEEQRRKDEEVQLVDKIVSEMEADQKRHEKKKEQTRRAMRKVFEQNAEAGTPNGIQIGLRRLRHVTVLLVPGWSPSFPNRILPTVQSRPFITDMALFSETSDAQVLSKSLPRPSQVLPSLRFPPHARESRPQMAEHCRVRCS
ncbi:unnamed protein product [Cladocopium goreaui]|uniref:Uncharacterized protein n=1 Tax=Cladocopium goreaui TaxID=2562237 RepID=A0A9P1BW22_9DINO|nr:unnamed protein product [Cladocopium goreaui]